MQATLAELRTTAPEPQQAFLPELTTHVKSAFDHDNYTLALDVRWVGGTANRSQYSQDTVGIDSQIDDTEKVMAIGAA